MTTRVPEDIPRTQDEILARAVEIAEEDMFGMGREILLGRLDFAHVAALLPTDTRPEQWDAVVRDLPVLPVTASTYLAFAMDRACDHKGISAHRSMITLREVAWLAGLDDVVQAMADAPFKNYGVPKLRAFAYGAGLQDVWHEHETPELRRMAVGAPCQDGCLDGCGR